MDFGNFSPKVIIVINGEEKAFSKYPSANKPLPEDCHGNITGIKLDYAACGEQDFGILYMARSFNLTKEGIVKKIPDNLEIINEDGVTALRYGQVCFIDHRIVNGTKKSGILGYWDDNNLFICASDEYKFLIAEIRKILIPNKCMFGFSKSFGGNDLCIVTTE